MLDIISMITFILLFMGLPLFLIIKGGSYKTDDEQEIENEEQMQYLAQYRKNRKKSIIRRVIEQIKKIINRLLRGDLYE